MKIELLLQQKPFHFPLLPSSCPYCVRGIDPGVRSWLGQLPVHPCSPLACAWSLEARAPDTHPLLVPFPEVIT